MEYPKRIENHIKETDSFKILNKVLPSEWIIREINERDYGVDMYLEIVEEDKLVKGDLLALQIKGSTEITFNSKNIYPFSGVKKSTIRYWQGLPIQVFLILVDVKKEAVYWNSINQESRRRRFDGSSKTCSFYFKKELNLNSELGISGFKDQYMHEKKWPYIEKAMIDCITDFNSFGPLFLYIKRNQDKSEISAVIQHLIIRYYDIYQVLSKFMLQKTPKEMTYWYGKHALNCLDSDTIRPTFSFSVALEILDEIVSDYWQVACNTYKIITSDESDYWTTKFPYILALLKLKPIQFIYDDWFSRYYFDEYENETKDLLHCMMSDLDL